MGTVSYTHLDVYKRQPHYHCPDRTVQYSPFPVSFYLLFAGLLDYALYGLNPVSYTHLDVYKRQDIVDKGTQGGGCIEVYANVEDAEKRNTYLSAFDGAGMLNPGSHTVLGTIVIRTSDKLTATQQDEFTQKISDKLLELQ